MKWTLHTDDRGHQLLTRDDIPEDRLCLRMVACSPTEEMLIQRILTLLNVADGTPRGRLVERADELAEVER